MLGGLPRPYEVGERCRAKRDGEGVNRTWSQYPCGGTDDSCRYDRQARQRTVDEFPTAADAGSIFPLVGEKRFQQLSRALRDGYVLEIAREGAISKNSIPTSKPSHIMPPSPMREPVPDRGQVGRR